MHFALRANIGKRKKIAKYVGRWHFLISGPTKLVVFANQPRLLCIVGELAGGVSVAVAVDVGDR